MVAQETWGAGQAKRRYRGSWDGLVRFGDEPGPDRFTMYSLMTNGEICLPRDLIAHLDDAVRVLLG